jgi:phosphoglucomutase/phosphomannomutase
MPGSEGMDRMQEVMQLFREKPPWELAGSGVKRLRDYLRQKIFLPDGRQQPLAGPHGDLVILDLEVEDSGIEGNCVAIRPSGTEPKIKLYMFAYEPPEQLANMDAAHQSLAERLDRVEADMRMFAGV